MRRVSTFVLCALACVAATGAGAARADDSDPPSSTTTTSTTAPKPKPTTTTSPVNEVPHGTTTTTSKASTATTAPGATTTTAKTSTGAKPPPASGASQPLDPSIVGGSIVSFDTSTTLLSVTSGNTSPTAAPSGDPSAAIQVTSKKAGTPGSTLILAALAWLASLGGLLVYAEDQRGNKWRHLAR